MSSNESFVFILLGVLAAASPWIVCWLLKVFFGAMKSPFFVCAVVACFAASFVWNFPELTAEAVDFILSKL